VACSSHYGSETHIGHHCGIVETAEKHRDGIEHVTNGFPGRFLRSRDRIHVVWVFFCVSTWVFWEGHRYIIETQNVNYFSNFKFQISLLWRCQEFDSRLRRRVFVILPRVWHICSGVSRTAGLEIPSEMPAQSTVTPGAPHRCDSGIYRVGLGWKNQDGGFWGFPEAECDRENWRRQRGTTGVD
jgi:hypothetical protein